MLNQEAEGFHITDAKCYSEENQGWKPQKSTGFLCQNNNPHMQQNKVSTDKVVISKLKEKLGV